MFHPASHIALHAAASFDVALCASLGLPAGDGSPEWVHLLPSGEIATSDGRGPYHAGDLKSLAAASLPAGERLPIDENHATDLAAPLGQPAPARGWIVELQAREDGLWGKVEWTPTGARLVKGRAYRGISPVIQHDKANRVQAILRAALVNKPNLRGLTALHQEQNMNLLARLAASLSLTAAATEDEVVAKVTDLAKGGDLKAALHQALDPIGALIGLQAGSDAAAVLAGVQLLKTAPKTGDSDQVVIALQAELVNVTNQLNALVAGGKADKATAFVDEAIKAGRVGVKPQRDHYIAMHQENPARTEAIINALPSLNGAIVPSTPPANPGEISLNAEQRQVAGALGITEAAMLETVKAEAAGRQAAL